MRQLGAGCVERRFGVVGPGARQAPRREAGCPAYWLARLLSGFSPLGSTALGVVQRGGLQRVLVAWKPWAAGRSPRS